jgi:hypothetical protein
LICFNNNQGIGGFQPLEYQIPVVQPLESSWTRQLAQRIPENPKMKKNVSVKDRMIFSSLEACTFIVKSPDELLVVDSDSRSLGPHSSRLMYINNDKVHEVLRIEKYGKRSMSPVMNINGDILLVTTYESGEQKYCLICISPEFELKWEYEFDIPILTKPTVDKYGNIYIYAMTSDMTNPNCIKDGTLYCIGQSGNLLWSKLFGRYSWHEPIMLKNDLIYFGVYESLFNMNTQGEVVSTVNGFGICDRFIPVADAKGTIYISRDTGIQAIATEGKVIWTYKPEKGWLNHSPSISANGCLYSTSNWRDLVCIDINGQKKWSSPVKGSADRPPLIGQNGFLCHFGVEPRNNCPVSIIQIFDKNGKLVWESEYIKGAIKSILPSGDGRLFVLNNAEYYTVNRDGSYKASWELYEIS